MGDIFMIYDNSQSNGESSGTPDIRMTHFEQTFKLISLSVIFATQDMREKSGSTDLREELRNFRQVHGEKRKKLNALISANPYPLVRMKGVVMHINAAMLENYMRTDISSNTSMRDRIAKWQVEAAPFLEEMEKRDSPESENAYGLYAQIEEGLLNAFYMRVTGSL